MAIEIEGIIKRLGKYGYSDAARVLYETLEDLRSKNLIPEELAQERMDFILELQSYTTQLDNNVVVKTLVRRQEDLNAINEGKRIDEYPEWTDLLNNLPKDERLTVNRGLLKAVRKGAYTVEDLRSRIASGEKIAKEGPTNAMLVMLFGPNPQK